MLKVTGRLDRAALVVIDMQPVFQASQEQWLIENVKREIRHAKRRKEPILMVRYRQGHLRLKEESLSYQIDPRLLRTLGKYSNVFWLEKTRADGSNQIVATLKRHHLPKKNIKVCGVNTDACVADTVNELSRKMPLSSIIVLSDACHTDAATRRYTGRKLITRRNNVRRVNIKFRPPRLIKTG